MSALRMKLQWSYSHVNQIDTAANTQGNPLAVRKHLHKAMDFP